MFKMLWLITFLFLRIRYSDWLLILSLLHFILYFFEHSVYLVIRVIIGFVVE